METLLAALAGCSGISMLSILRKKRQNITHYEIHVCGKQAETYPHVLAFFIVLFMTRNPRIAETLTHLGDYPLLPTLVQWTSSLNSLLPIGVGVMLADRLYRDRRTHVDELFHSMRGALSARLAGKYFGCLFATMIPVLLFYGIGVGVIAWQTHNIMALPLALATFAGIMLPGFLFITSFSLACTAIMWVPLYQFLFICYWFWGNELGTHTGIPTISGTILTPDGKYAVHGNLD